MQETYNCGYTKALLDKKMFYAQLELFENKHESILIDMPINKENWNIRLIYDWTPKKMNGEFNPIMYAQLVDVTKTVGHGKYIVPDLFFNAVDLGITTDYKLYKFLNKQIEEAFERKGVRNNDKRSGEKEHK